MKKEKILTYSMIGFYCLWCMLEIYMIFSGTRLSGQSVSESTMQIRMGLYNVKNVLGYALAFVFALDCWYFGFYKTKIHESAVSENAEKYYSFIGIICCNDRNCKFYQFKNRWLYELF